LDEQLFGSLDSFFGAAVILAVCEVLVVMDRRIRSLLIKPYLRHCLRWAPLLSFCRTVEVGVVRLAFRIAYFLELLKKVYLLGVGLRLESTEPLLEETMTESS